MMRKFTVCLVLCVTGLFVSSCNDDVSSPPKSALAVDKTSGLAGDTEFTFTVDQTSGDAISLLPYGTANLSLGGILIPASSFTSGKATVKFKYAKVGAFDAVVVSNNHSSDGKSVKNTYSQPVTVTITSPKKEITEFFFDKINIATDADIDQDDMTIDVTVPYGTNLTALKASFTSDEFSSVSVGSTAQVSGETANNFTTDQPFTVKAADGTTQTYTVHIITTAINTVSTFKSFTGLRANKSVLPSALATTGTDLILYDTLGTTTAGDDFKEVAISYALDNPFAVLHSGSSIPGMGQGANFDLRTPKTVTLMAQDSATVQHVYGVYAAEAPKLTLESALPTTVDVNTKFNILIKALKTTVTDSKLDLKFVVTLPTNVVVNNLTLTDDDHDNVDYNVGQTATINFNDAVTIVLHVIDNVIGKSYDVTYTAGLTELK